MVRIAANRVVMHQQQKGRFDMADVTCKTETIDGAVVVSIGGEIDFNAAPELRIQLQEATKGASKMIVDLSGVPYMDSSGVAVLVEALQTQRKAGNALVLCNLQPKVVGIFEIARLDMVFKIVEDLEAAKTA